MMEKAIKLFAAISVAAGSIAAVLSEYRRLTSSMCDEVKELPTQDNTRQQHNKYNDHVLRTKINFLG